LENLVWRVRRTLAGDALGASWVDVADDTPARARRVLAPRVYPAQPWELVPGAELVPRCQHCDSVCVWRGAWRCAGCAARAVGDVDGVDMPRSLPREALAGAAFFSSSEGNNSTARAAARSQWLWAVEALTSFQRRARAARLRRGPKRADVTWVDWETGELRPASLKTSQWHEQRVRGVAERFERVAQCGAYEYALDVVDSSGKRTSRPLQKRCDCWRVCPRCLARRKWKLGEGMRVQQDRISRRFYRETARFYRGSEGKWSTKLITFTVPHGSGGPSGDARALVDAWPKMLRIIRRHLVCRATGGRTARDVDRGTSKPAVLQVPWVRALEVAASDERPDGHAHLHVWWVGPYLDVALLQLWWGRLLAGSGVGGLQHEPWSTFARRSQGKREAIDPRVYEWAGKPDKSALLPCGIVDIRSEKNAPGALAAYTQKVGIALYVTKGTRTEALAPVHAASIYEVFEGVRAVQWARGWAPPKTPLRAHCVSFRRLTDEEKRLLNHSRITPRKEAKDDDKHDEKVEVVLGCAIARPPDIPRVLVRQLVLPGMRGEGA
jgi:hypothetical protein